MKLQIALDVDEKKALSICKKIKKYVDIIEIGTPLVKREGMDIIKKFKKFRTPIMADFKTMDTGFLEAEIAFKAGADIVSVCGSADNSTIKGAVRAAREYKKEVMVDLINVKNAVKRVKEIKKFGMGYVLIHTGIDAQKRGKNPLGNLEKVSKMMGKQKIAVAGGISLKNINKIKKFEPEIVIVGSAITKAKNPKEVARKLKGKLR